MPFLAVQPPADESKLAEVGKELYDAAHTLGIQLEIQGFLMAWLNGTRVLIERDADGKIVSMALLACGQRWTHNDFKASLLAIAGNIEPMLEFVKQICSALGATSLFYELEEPEDRGGQLIHTVIEMRMQ